MSKEYTVAALLNRGEFLCACGKRHKANVKDCLIGSGVLAGLGELILKYHGTCAYILADENTFTAAGEAVLHILAGYKIDYCLCLYPGNRAEPDEKLVGKAFLHLQSKCDLILVIGTGVLNDTGKILSKTTGLPQITVATAPSMDGFVSSTSSVIRDGLKVSLPSKCPEAVIGDTNIMCKAPYELLNAGLGDMLAKYISICEWRIGNLVTGEYYCEEVAKLVRFALKQCVDNASGLNTGNPESVQAVMEGLVLSGIAADFAGVSRAVSGTEHYISHLWDMRNAAFGTSTSLHGLQCSIGTLISLKAYESFLRVIPNSKKAEEYFAQFDKEAWFEQLRQYLGNGANTMIEAAKTGAPYNINEHKQRLKAILINYDKIIKVIKEELPSYEWVKSILLNIKAPVSPLEIGLPENDLPLLFRMTRDIRDKYILPSLEWDLGVIEEEAEHIIW